MYPCSDFPNYGLTLNDTKHPNTPKKTKQNKRYEKKQKVQKTEFVLNETIKNYNRNFSFFVRWYSEGNRL